MAAYAAAVFFKAAYSNLLHYFDDALPLEARSMFEGANKELKWLQDFVERLDSRRRKRMTAWLQQIPEALQESIQRLYHAKKIDEVVEITRIVLETLKKLQEDLLEYEEEVVSSWSSSKIIGSRDERSKLKEALVNYDMVKESIFILHGMAGIGKTMLAREVYEDLDISEWFECRAWVTAGIEWRSEQSTEAILAQVDPEMVMRGDREEIAQTIERMFGA